MKRFLLLAFLFLAFSLSASAQNARFSIPWSSISSSTSIPFLVAAVPPNSPILAVCNFPAVVNASGACINYATTYTSAGVACANGAQDTPDPQPSACQATGDAQGNMGFWAPPGKYTYTVCIQNTTSCFGPYSATLGLPNTIASMQTGPRPTIANWHGWSWTGASSNVNGATGYGDSPSFAGNSEIASSIAPTATDGYYFRLLVSTSTAFWGGVTSSVATTQSSAFTTGILQYTAQRVRISIGGSERCWIGYFDASQLTAIGSQLLNADTLSNNFVGFRYSTGAGDTKWMAITNNGSAQNAVSTGITPDANPHVFAITQSSSGATINFLIDGVQVATSSTDVPANSFLLRPLNQIQALGAVTNTMDTAWVYWETLP